MRTVVVGNLAIDYIGRSVEAPSGDQWLLETLYAVPGGRGGNVCAVTASLGGQCVLLAHVGDDFAGSTYETRLLNLGVDLASIYRASQAVSPHAFVLQTLVGERVYFYRGLNDDDKHALQERIAQRCGRADYQAIVATSGLPVHNATALESASSSLRVFAPAHDISQYGATQLLRCLENTDVLAVNSREAIVVERLLDLRLHDIVRSSRLSLAVVTRGREGSTLLDGASEFGVLPCPPRVTIDAVGAGDAFVAGFVHHFLRSGDGLASAKFGSAAAAFALEGRGCQERLPTAEQVLERSKAVYG